MDTSNPNFTHTNMIYTHVCKYNVYVYLLYYVLTANHATARVNTIIYLKHAVSRYTYVNFHRVFHLRLKLY